MKLLKKHSLKEWIIYISCFTIPAIVILLINNVLDNDLWYLLTEGRYIIQNGIYHIDPLSMHTGLEIVVQNWLSAVIFWIVYAFLGIKGIIGFVVLINVVICYLIYKICMTISDDNKTLSLIIMLVTDINLSLYFIVSRPQIFSFVILLLLILLLELYIKHDNDKYLKFIPLLSFIEINMHASLWWMFMLFMFTYLIDMFKIPKLKLQGYRKKPLIIAFIISLLVGFINPYGYKAITFIFTSYGDKYMMQYISELQPFTINNFISKHLFAIIIITMLFYVFFREEKIRIRHLCMYCGTLILGVISIKGFSHFILVSTFPIALLLKDKVPKDLSNVKKKWLKIVNTCLTYVIGITSIGLFIFALVRIQDKIFFDNAAKDAIDCIDFFTGGKTANVYTSFNHGGYAEFRGYKAYIDPRAEVFLKKNNKKDDIHSEYYDFQFGQISVEDFLAKYNFDFMLVDVTDRLYFDMNYDNYFVIYDDTDTFYKVYARNDIVPDETRNLIIQEYLKTHKMENGNSNNNNNNNNNNSNTQNTNTTNTKNNTKNTKK